MIQFIISNLPTIIVSLLLLAMVSMIIRKIVRDKKQGKSCCSGGEGCNGCCHSTSSSGDSCHS
ncbi:FeoB-associated Cys-rich membrane protein [Konateibacter massiliensis]|uniref:FeoB-associated Cys-rich membrane protein n=1 Tax=Konateibacter massiliensis TaxID=2002841 RepID=UPI000C14D612|nr:FeoB-associated Cys-rich membrane protein [Konateibacter massiliensis]